MTEAPITPTRIIPFGAGLPRPAYAPPTPPIPPTPPTWWTTPQPPPTPGPLDVRVTVDLVLPGPPPDPERRWWQRIRWGYNAGCLLCAMPLAGLWTPILASARNDAGLAAAWTLAAAPLAVLGVLDNARRVEAEYAYPDLWAPKLRAARARILLDACLIATATTLPATTVTYLITGVRP